MLFKHNNIFDNIVLEDYSFIAARVLLQTTPNSASDKKIHLFLSVQNTAQL